MKFTVTVYCKDDLRDAMKEASEGRVSVFVKDHNDDGYRDGLVSECAESTEDICREWFRDLEYLTVEIDTAQRTIRVVPN